MEIKVRPEDITVVCNLYKESKDVSLIFEDSIENQFHIQISIETAKDLAEQINRHKEIQERYK